MVWYYAESGQQRGPISDSELDEMIANGRLDQQSLLWRDGMENWQPVAEVRPPAVGALPPLSMAGSPAAAPIPATFDVAAENCQNCGRPFPGNLLRRFANVRICHDCVPNVVQSVQQSYPAAGYTATTVPQVQYGGFWLRSIAKSIDHLLIGLIMGPFTMAFMPHDLKDNMANILVRTNGDPQAILKQIEEFNLAVFPFLITALVVYNALFVAMFNGTPGKLLCGLRVVSSDNSRIAFAQAIARAVIPGLLIIGDRFTESPIGTIILLVGYLMVAFDAEKRSLFDRICRTRVVRR